MNIVTGYNMIVNDKKESNEKVCYECYYAGSHLPYYNLDCMKAGHRIKDENDIMKILVCPNGLEGDIFLTLITDLIRLLTDDNIFNYRFTFRYHPHKQWQDKDDEYFNSTIANTFLNKNRLVFDKSTELHQQIYDSDLVIVGESTVAYEVLALGTKVVHYKHDKSLSHIDKNIFVIVESISDLYRIIKREMN